MRKLLETFIVAYMGIPKTQRIKFADKLILNFPEFVPGEIESYEARYRWFKKMYYPLLEWINKHPIFAHIYFTQRITVDIKAGVYSDVLRTYKYLMTTDANGSVDATTTDPSYMMHNLTANGASLKKMINAMLVMYLYLSEYQPYITKLYDERNINWRDEFFRLLWKQYFDEIWNRRIMEYYKRVFSSENIGGTYRRFLKPWGALGRFIDNAKSAVKSAFTKPVSTPADPGPEKDDNAGEKQAE
jgi:hypothetical protein